MAERSSPPARPVEGRPRTRTGFRYTIGNTLANRGRLVAIVFLMVVAGACGGDGQGSAADQQNQTSQLFGGQDQNMEQQDQKSQLFATDPVRLDSGLAIVTMTHQGKGDFVVNLLSTRQEETVTAPEPFEFSGDQNGRSTREVARALAKETGPVAVSKAVNIPVAGQHILDVKADGPWTVEVEQPHPSSAPKPTTFSGNNDTATPFFELSSGLKQITMTNLDEKNLGVSLLDKDGNTAKISVLDNYRSQPGSNRPTVSWTVNVREHGIYLFDVRSDTLWTLNIADADQPAVDVKQTSITGQGANAPTGLRTVLIFLINIAWALILAVVIRFSPT